MENNLNYFKEYYLEFLNENHPDYVKKQGDELEELVEDKAKLAFKAFNEAREGGADLQQSLEFARELLKEGKKFSRYDVVYNIVEERFTKIFEKWIAEGILKENCIRITEDCEDIFKLFDTTDDFVYEDELENSIFERIKTLKYVV